MPTLMAGVVLWSLVHLFPALAPGMRAGLATRVGEQAYRGLFAGLILVALVLIVVGWRTTLPAAMYSPPFRGGVVVPAMMFASFYLLAGASAPGNARRIFRHPMLLGMMLWSAAHLFANGDSRSLVLFGGMGLWALLEIVLINRRDRTWERPAAVPAWKDAVTLGASSIVYGVVLYLHGFLFGVSPIPGL